MKRLEYTNNVNGETVLNTKVQTKLYDVKIKNIKFTRNLIPSDCACRAEILM